MKKKKTMSNTNPCGGPDNEGDGCGVVFSRMLSGGLHCALCRKLKAPGLTAETIAGLVVRLTSITLTIAAHPISGNPKAVL